MQRRSSTAQAFRGAAKAEAAQRLESARVEAGVSQAELAAALGVSPTQVRHYEDPAHPATWSAADLMGLAGIPEVALPLLRYLLEPHGYALHETPRADSPEANLRICADAIKECNEATEFGLEAVTTHGGVVTPQQGARLAKECTEAIEKLGTLRALAMRADLERGLRVVRPWAEGDVDAG